MWFRVLAGAALLILLVEAACGDSYDAAETANDGGASSDVAPSSEAATPPSDASGVLPGVRCDHRAPFTSVERVAGLPNGAYCARLSADETTAYFSIDNEIRIARRPDGGPFGIATKVQKVDDKGTCPTLTADQRVLYYEDYFGVLQQSGDPGGPYSAKTPISGVPAPSGIGQPFLDEPRRQLYATYHLDPKNYFGNTAIGVAAVEGGNVGAFRRVDVGFGVTGGEGAFDAKAPPTYAFQNPTVSADGLAIYFTTDHSPAGPNADANVWVATRASFDTDFSDPLLLEGVNTKQTEGVSWVSPDNCRLYFSSDRENPGVFSVSMFVATRSP